jgi:hypothetical protein
MENLTVILILRSNTGGFDGIGTMYACKKASTVLAFLLILPTILENMVFRFPGGDYYNFTTQIFGTFLYELNVFSFDWKPLFKKVIRSLGFWGRYRLINTALECIFQCS